MKVSTILSACVFALAVSSSPLPEKGRAAAETVAVRRRSSAADHKAHTLKKSNEHALVKRGHKEKNGLKKREPKPKKNKNKHKDNKKGDDTPDEIDGGDTPEVDTDDQTTDVVTDDQTAKGTDDMDPPGAHDTLVTWHGQGLRIAIVADLAYVEAHAADPLGAVLGVMEKVSQYYSKIFEEGYAISFSVAVFLDVNGTILLDGDVNAAPDINQSLRNRFQRHLTSRGITEDMLAGRFFLSGKGTAAENIAGHSAGSFIGGNLCGGPGDVADMWASEPISGPIPVEITVAHELGHMFGKIPQPP